jgi:hypothetical protein
MPGTDATLTLQFTGGPVSGSTFPWPRRPQFLRIAIDEGGEARVIAGDESPKGMERCHAYELYHDPQIGPVYHSIQPQPSRPVTERARLWQAWCIEQVEARKAGAK